MHTLKLKHISHEFNYPDVHESSAWIRHVLSSEFFWSVFALVVLVSVLTVFAIFVGTGVVQAPDVVPGMPYYHFLP